MRGWLVVRAANCIGPFDKLRASSSARKRRGPQDDSFSGADAGWTVREAWWKRLAGLVVARAGKGSFDFADRFALRIGPLRSG